MRKGSLSSIKASIQNLLFPIGSTQTILAGLLKGYKIKVSETTQWAPLIGRWEPTMQKIMVKILRESDIVYDLGANIGLHGMLCARAVGNSGHVYNFEPLPSNIQEIEYNYKLNHITNYSNIQKVVSNSNGIVQFQVANHATQGKVLIEGKSSELNYIEVEAITLDEFISMGRPAPNFIKIDIEGAEGYALEGFSKNIEKTFPVMIVELHSPEADKKVGQFLQYFHYSAYRFDTFSRGNFEKIKNLMLPYPHPDGIWGSILCLPSKKELEDYQLQQLKL